jgi:hypothetical protein
MSEYASTLRIPISDEQHALVANLVDRGDIDFEALMEQGYPSELSRAELSVWLNDHSASLRQKREDAVSALQARVREYLAQKAEGELVGAGVHADEA